MKGYLFFNFLDHEKEENKRSSKIGGLKMFSFFFFFEVGGESLGYYKGVIKLENTP